MALEPLPKAVELKPVAVEFVPNDDASELLANALLQWREQNLQMHWRVIQQISLFRWWRWLGYPLQRHGWKLHMRDCQRQSMIDR